MYVLKPNPVYSFDKNKNLYFKNTKITTNNIISLDLYGYTITNTLDWFYNLACYKIELPPELQHRISEITFRSYGRKFGKELECLISSVNPMVIENKFAIPLSYSTFAISEDGEIMNVHTREIIPKNKSKYFNYDYPKLYIDSRSFYIHRVMLEAWVWNDDPNIKYYVNHIDGNKTNYRLSNLEWCTPSDNMIHAVNNSLRNDNIITSVKHKSEKDVHKFGSVSEACKFIKSRHYLVGELTSLYLGKTINGYEVRVNGDDRDWYFITGEEKEIPKKANTIYKLTKDDKYLDTFFNYKDVNKYLQLSLATPFYRAVELAKNNGITIINQPVINTHGYEAYDVINKRVIYADTLDELSKKVNVSKNIIHKRSSQHSGVLSNNMLFRAGKNINWDNITFKQKENSSISLYSIDENGVIKDYSSIREAERQLGFTQKTIKRILDTDIKYNNYLLKTKGP